MPYRKEHLTLIQLFSKYIFAKSNYQERNRLGTLNKIVHHVFFLCGADKR